MIIYLKSANFASSNIGTLNSWRVSYSLSGGISKLSCPGSVTKDGTLTATLTLADGAEFTSASVSSGTAGTLTHSVSGTTVTITVPNVQSAITVSAVATGESTGGGEEEYTLTINPTPSNATVTLTASGYTQSGNSITVANGTTVNWRVSADGYTGQSGTWTANGSDGSKSVTLSAVVVDGSTTWYVDHRSDAAKFTASVNIAGRGWSHVPGTDVYNAYVGKPVNTVGFFTNKASQEVTISKVVEKGGEADMTEIATVTLTNPSGATKGFCSVSFPTVTLADGECLAVYTQTDSDIQFYYQSSGGPTNDANGIADGSFYGRVPKVYGSGTAWTSYTDALCLGMSVGYNSEIA